MYYAILYSFFFLHYIDFDVIKRSSLQNKNMHPIGRKENRIIEDNGPAFYNFDFRYIVIMRIYSYPEDF